MEYAYETYSDKVVYYVIYGIGPRTFLRMKIEVPNDGSEETFEFVKMSKEDSSMSLVASGVALVTILGASVL